MGSVLTAFADFGGAAQGIPGAEEGLQSEIIEVAQETWGEWGCEGSDKLGKRQEDRPLDEEKRF